MVRELLQERQRVFAQELYNKQKKQVYYLSMEFLVGKNLKNNLFQLGLTEPMAQALAATGTSLEELIELESRTQGLEMAALAGWRPAT